jgi:predicted SAM-dependent methyltransferase
MRLDKLPQSEGIKVVIGTRTYLGPDWIHVDADSFKLHNPLDGTWHDVDLVCDARSIPLPDNYADLVFSSECLEHFPWKEYRQALAEWCRILKPGGMMRIEVPDFLAACRQILETDSLEGDRAMQQIFFAEQMNQYDFHYCGLTHRMLIDDFESLGFEVKDVLEGSSWGWLKVDAEKPISSKDYLLRVDAKKSQGSKLNKFNPDKIFPIEIPTLKCIQASRGEWVDGVIDSNGEQKKKILDLTKDISENGMLNPVDLVYNKSNRVLTLVDGHHRVFIASAMGLKMINANLKISKTHLDHGVLLTEKESSELLKKCGL